MKALHAICIASVLLAPAGASAQDWKTWDDMMVDLRSFPHTETKDCQGRFTCTLTTEAHVAGHRLISKRVIGPGVDKKLICMDNKQCVPW